MLAQGILAMLLAMGAAEPTAQDAPSQNASGLVPYRLQVDARLGFGALKLTADGDPILNGLGFPVALSAGLSLTKSLVVFGEISDTHMLLFDTLNSNATSVFDWYGIGAGLKYYLTPNTFISGSASIARLQFKSWEYALDISHWGAMARVAVGREWPVSPTWSVGVAGEYQLGRMQSGGLNNGYPGDTPERRYQPWGLSMLALASYHQAGPAATATPDSTASPRGLYLDVRTGLGKLWPRVGDQFDMTGTTTPIALSAGLRLNEHVIAFADFSDIHMFGTSARYGTRIYSLDLYSAGLGLKTYLTPRTFLSGSASFAQLHYEGVGFDETSHRGILARLALGREWPISPSWSVGAAAELQYGQMDVGDDFQITVIRETFNGTPYTIKGLSLLGLASFNPFAKRESTETQATSPAPPGYHTHDGLYVNASLGPGWTWLNTREWNDQTFQYAGRGTHLEVSLGYAFANSLVVFGEWSELQVHDPEASIREATTARYAFGPGLRYYLMPANVFFSGAVFLSRVGIYGYQPNEPFANVESQWGALGQIAVGKEWWVLGDLGIGVAAEFGYGKFSGDDTRLTYSSKTFSLVASVSYN